uniref:Dipeptide epimerase n=1 Tax=uncultured bacterium AOCefta2 TaxID=654977 RepID=D6MLY0_9BACT|nr:chloromuconate cycloisomerase [uncultured bacterium AOCefta2]
MKFKHSTYTLNLINPFGIARSTKTQSPVVLVNLDGGWGESAPTNFYGENADTVHAALQKMEALDVADLDCIEDIDDALLAIAPKDQSARAAVDIALHDRLAKNLNVPLYKLFGKSPDKEMITSFTIGIDTVDEMMRKVDEAKQYDILKIKLGKDLEQDLAVMKEIRKAVGDKTVRVDANGGWTLEQAKQALPAMADLGVEYVEQPLYKGSHAELKELKKGAPLPIFVDEDSMVAKDLPKLIGAVDGINIKLMKSGGIAEARRMIALGRALDFQIMIGCMIETSVAISAAAHLGPFCDFLDLDGNLLISNDPFAGVECEKNGRIHLSDAPGLGVVVRSEYANAVPA